MVQAPGSLREHSGCVERAEGRHNRGAACDCPEWGCRQAHGHPQTPPASIRQARSQVTRGGRDRAKTLLRLACIDTGRRHAH
jgi:hypothetical protein